MKLSTTIFLLFIVFFVILLLGGPILVKAQGGINFVEIENPLKAKSIEEIICAIIGLLTTIALPLAGIMLIWGGIQIMTGYSTGEKEKKVVQGKKTITYAVIGYAIVLMVKFIVEFVVEILKGTAPPMCK